MTGMAQSYERIGFELIRGVFSQAQVLLWQALAKKTVASELQSTPPHPYHSVIFSVHQLALRYPEFEPLVRSPVLGSIAKRLLGGQPCILLDQLICKWPLSDPTIPHQDAPFLPIGDQPTANCWIALNDVDEQNGALVYFEGSHRLPKFPLVHLDGDPSQLDPSDFGMSPSTLRMRAGDCVFHDGLTIHGANPNSRNVPRFAISIQYIVDGATAYEPLHDSMRDMGILPGDRLTSTHFMQPYANA